MSTLRYLANITAGIALAALAACGGGGGGGGGVSAVVYSGNTSPAVITTTNASTITANVMGGDEAAIIGGVSTESSGSTKNQGTGPADLAKRLGQVVREVALHAKPTASNQQVVTAAVPIDTTDPCEGGGTIRIFGTLNDDLTGMPTFVFSNCVLSGLTLNGSGTIQINVFLTDFTMSFARLALRASGLSIDAGGSIHFVETGNTLTITINLDEMINTTGKMRKTVNLVIVNVFNDISNPTSSFTEELTGQVFHSDYGFVTVTTSPLFAFGTAAQLFPDSGEMLLTGDANRTIRVKALNSTLVQLQLDTNGDGNVDNTARLKWIELGGPVGANLGDDDGDGMHNSWETFYGGVGGLDPNNNNDGDTFTNLEEYQNGTDPNVA